MNVSARTPFNPPRMRHNLQITTWGDALRNCRIQASQKKGIEITHRSIADFLGVSRSTVRDWEEGLAFPSSVQVKMLHKRGLKSLQAFNHLLPNVLAETVAKEEAKESDGQVTYAEPRLAQIREETQAIERPKSFGAGLRLCRRSAGFSQEDVGDLLKVHMSSISTWEMDKSSPIQEHYEKLCSLFDGLRDMPVPKGMQNIPKPGPATQSPDSVSLSIPTDVAVKEFGKTTQEVRKAAEQSVVVVPNVQASAHGFSDAEEAGLAYARALISAGEKRKELIKAKELQRCGTTFTVLPLQLHDQTSGDLSRWLSRRVLRCLGVQRVLQG